MHRIKAKLLLLLWLIPGFLFVADSQAIDQFVVWQCGRYTAPSRGCIYLYPCVNNTAINLYGSQISDTNITTQNAWVGNFANAGNLGGQPWNPVCNFGPDYYFYANTNFPFPWEIDNVPDGTNSDYGVWLMSPNGSGVGNVFFTHLNCNGGDASSDQTGDAVSVYNPNAFAVPVDFARWNGANWVTEVTGQVIQAQSIWMSGGTIGFGATGTRLPEAGDFRVVCCTANVCVHKGFIQAADHDTFFTNAIDVNTGLKIGTDMIGLASSTPLSGVAAQSIMITAGPAGAHYTIFQYVPNGPAPVGNFMVGMTNSGNWIQATNLPGNAGVLGANGVIALPAINGNNNANAGEVNNFYRVVTDNPVQVAIGTSILSSYGASDWADSFDNLANPLPMGNNFTFSYYNLFPQSADGSDRYVTAIFPNAGTTATLSGPAGIITGVSNNPPGTIAPIAATNSRAQTSAAPYEAKVWQLNSFTAGLVTLNLNVNSGGPVFFNISGDVNENSEERTVEGMMNPGGPNLTVTCPNTPTVTSTPTITWTPNPCPVERIYAGATNYTDTSGNVWQAFQNYSAGGYGFVGAGDQLTGSNILGTNDSALYQNSAISSSFQCIFTLPDGNYELTMKFAECWLGATIGTRVFTVTANGTPIATNLDVYATVGDFYAYDVNSVVTVAGGLLTLDFTASSNNAIVSAIQVQSLSCSTSTPTVTPTVSPTASLTCTSTNSPTSSATPTASPTATITSTATASPTASNTGTVTSTATPTATDTWMASPTFSNTATATATLSQTSTPTISNTASSTATTTFTFTITLTSTITWTPSLTLTPSITWTPSKTPTQTNTATVTATNTPVMTNLELKVYNEAGEVVKTFSNVLVLGGFSGIQLSSGSGSTIFDPNSGLFDIEIKSAGIIYHVPWDGKSDLGYLVDSGQYVLKADIPGLQGNTVVMPLTVLKSGDLLTVSIYTTSGELVKQLYQSYFVQGQLGSMKLTSNLLQISNQPTGTTTIGINIFSSTGQLMADGLGSLNQARLTWDGTTALGNYVQSGEYLIKIDQTYNHQHDVLVQSVTVLSSNLSGFMDASVYPNPYLSTPDHKVWFKVALQDQSSLTVRIYDVVGELVNTLSLPAAGPGIATLGWDVNNTAAGLYVGIVEAASQVSGQTQKKPLKISVIK